MKVVWRGYGGSEVPQLFGRGPTHTAKAAVIRRETRVGVAGPLALPGRGPTLVGAELPTSSPDDALHILPGARRSAWIHRRTLPIVRRAVDVLAPLGHISVKVIDPESVGPLLAGGMCLLFRVLREPGV